MSTPAHIVPEWYFLPVYAILRSIPNKLAGVAAIGLVFVSLLLLPFINTSSIRSSNFRPLHKKLFWLFVGYHSRRPGLCGDRKPSICTDAGHCIGFVGACWGVHRAFFHQALPDAEAAALSACGNRRHDDRRMHHRAVSWGEEMQTWWASAEWYRVRLPLDVVNVVRWRLSSPPGSGEILFKDAY